MRVTKSLRKSLLLFLCFALIVSWGSMFSTSKASAASSALAPMGQPVEQIHTEGVNEASFGDCQDDCATDLLPIGFDFEFNLNGTSYTQLYASTNGHITFTAPSTSWNPNPSGRPAEYIAPFFDDLAINQNSKVLYTTIGKAPDRKFIIQYTNVVTYNYSTITDLFGTFQVILSEGTNNIQFRYPHLLGTHSQDQAFGEEALIGVKNAGGEQLYSFNQKSLAEKQALLFTPEMDGNDVLTGEYVIKDNPELGLVDLTTLLSLESLPGISTPMSPADGSYVSSSATFQWNAAAGATSYRLLIAKDAELKSLEVDESNIGQTSYDVAGLESGTYYWKIIAVNAAGNYTFSNTYRYEVPFDADTALPLNQSVETLINGEEIDFNNNYSVVVELPFEVALYNGHSSEIEISNNGYLWFDSEDYYSEIEQSLSFNPWSSKVLYATIGEAPNRKVVIQYTNMSLNGGSRPFGTFQVLFHESNKTIQFQYPYLIASNNGYATTQIELSSESNNDDDDEWLSSYSGRVAEKQAIRFSPNGPTSYVVSRNADYDPVLLIPVNYPTPSTLVSPADGSSSSTEVNFEWNNNTSGEISYDLLLATDAKFSPDSLVDLELDEPITDTSHTVSGLEEGKVYYWKVIAGNDNGISISNTYRFMVPFSNPSTTVSTDEVSLITSMTATAGGTVVTNGNSPAWERGIVYSKNTNPSYSANKMVAVEGTGAYTVDLVGLQSSSTYHARAYAISEGQVFYGQDVIFTTLGSHVSLSALSLSGITLDQSVSGSVYSYTASVPNTVSSTAVTATVQEANYRSVTANVYNSGNILVMGPIDLASGQVSDAIPLNVGINKMEIVVLALDGSGTTYTVTVNRATAPTPSSGGGGGSITVISKDGKLTLLAGKAGEVSLNNEIEIAIPANASKKQLELTIQKLLSTQGLLGNKEILASSVYEILKNFTENFDNPVTITISFNPLKLKSGQTVAIFYYDEVKKTWVKVEGSKISKDRISAEVNHFTKFAALVVDEKTGLPVLEQSTGTTTDPTTEVKFSDISNHWAEASIKQAVSSGIVKGYTDGTFKPNATVTRAEFAVMLMNALKPQGDGAELKFTDNAKIGTWAQKAVAQAVQAGIIKGNQDGSFRPNAEVTRAEMAVMIANALGQPIEANAATGFADDKDIPAWAKGSVAIVKQAGIVQGKSGNKFAPQDHATRAEAVTVLLKLLVQKSS